MPRKPTAHTPAVLSLALAAAFAGAPLALQANPSGGVAVQGTAAMVANGNQLQVTTTNGAGTSRSVINWQSFSIPQGSSTNFQQPSAASTSINRVVTNNPSAIFGTLSSNGRLVLVNPAGITVGAGAAVDTAGFTAAVMNMSEADAKAGRMRFNADGFTGALSVQGNIIARGGDVVLIAPNAQVAAGAVVQAANGTVALVAGQQVEITGRGLEGIQLQVTAPGNQAINLGTLKGDAVGIFAGTLKHSGLIQATGVTVAGGRVVLSASSVAEVTGQISAQNSALAAAAATGSAIGSNGGSITVSADIAVLGGALSATGSGSGVGAGQGGTVSVQAGSIIQTGSVDASGVSIGGSVSLNGSRSVMQTADAVVRADASDGAGGTVVLQSAALNGSVLSSAQISANGSGSGGGSGSVGGTVQVLGASISLQAAQISADGDAGGGSIQVGGGKGGQDPLLPNSQRLYINAATQLSASARKRGDGGSVVLWSDGQNNFYGEVLALGAGDGTGLAGNGGFVEVSGKTGVQFGGTVSAAGGPGGASGTLLLDPKNITVAASAGGLGTLELTDPNPTPGLFGSNLINLGGNSVLVADANDNAGGVGAGAIYVFDKTTGALKSSLTGSHAGDGIGGNCSTVVGYSCGYSTASTLVFKSSGWNGGVGAWTFINATATSGPSGVVSASTSLVGVGVGDLATAYLVNNGSNPAVLFASAYNGGRGAVANVDPLNGMVGTLSSANALVGSTPGDNVGSGGYTSYGSTQWLVKSPSWSSSAGALTVINPSAIAVGTVSSTNSLVGAAAGDNVGSGGVFGFTGGALMVSSPNFSGGKGAFTVVGSLASLSGTVTAANSLVGNNSTDGAAVNLQTCTAGYYCYTPYAFPGYNYDNFVLLNTNAVGKGSLTLVKPTGAPTGAVSAGNSLVGSTVGDFAGAGISLFSNGGDSLVLNLPNWDNSTILNAGALTFTNLGSMATGVVGASNSIVGTATGDLTGVSLTTSGSYANLSGKVLLLAPNYGGGIIAGTGAVTVVTLPVTGTVTPLSGTLTAANALVGSTAGDRIGSGGVDTSQLDYWMIKSPSWNNNGTAASAGAVTFYKPSGTLGFPSGAVSGATNSWVGANANDAVGYNTSLVIFSNDNGLLVNRGWGGGAGAITLIADPAMPYGTISSANSYTGASAADGSGMTVRAFNSGAGTSYPTSALVSNQYWNGNRGFVTYVNQGQNFATLASPGAISANNSLVGKLANEYLGSGGITVLPEAGQAVVVVSTPGWGNGTISSAGAYTFFNATVGAGTGSITTANSILGNSTNALSSSTLYTDQYNYSYTAPTGKAVLVAPSYASGAGALLMFNLANPTVGASAFFGASATDRIGSGGIETLSYGTSGSFVLKSPSFGSGAGALTYVDGNNPTPFTQTVGSGNSLVGATTLANLGGGNTVISQYSNGKLVVLNRANTGSITLVQTPSSLAGTVAAVNSLVGSSVGDFTGATVYNDYYTSPYTRLFVTLPNWKNGALAAAGAVTALDVSAITSPSGAISATNSLVGSSAGDALGANGVQINSDGYVINTPLWSNGAVTSAGALTFFGIGAALPTGTISAANSVLGTATGDLTGASLQSFGITGKRILVASNYGGGTGAVAVLNFANPGVGTLNASNALVGSTSTDHIGSAGVAQIGSSALYLVGSPSWSSSTGALTVFNPGTGITPGIVSSANSLVGAAAGDQVGANVTSNYVSFGNNKLLFFTRTWGGGQGAITLVQNPNNVTGVINASNSLVGVTSADGASMNFQIYDDIGQNYYSPPTHAVVYSSSFNGGRGMVTVIDSSLATSPAGVISAANSLVGSTPGEILGASGSVSAVVGLGLQVRSPSWNGNRGAITVAAFNAPLVGTISSANSFLGVNANDQVGSTGFVSYSIGSGPGAYSGYYLNTPYYSNGLGAVSFLPTGSLVGFVSSANSVVGTVPGSSAYAPITVTPDGSAVRLDFGTGTGRVVYVDPRTSGSGSYSGGLGFSDSPGADATISAQTVATMLNAGTKVSLQANNDIVVIAAVSTSSAAAGLRLEAGRSVLVNANINLNGGDLTLIANSQFANASYRDAGNAELRTANGVTLSNSGGFVGALMDTGTGSAGGAIELGNVLGTGLEVRNWSTTAGAGIRQTAGSSWQTNALRMETRSASGSIGTLDTPITFGASWLAVRTGGGPVDLRSTASALVISDVIPSSGGSGGGSGSGGASNGDSRTFDDFYGITTTGLGSVALRAAGDVTVLARSSAVRIAAQSFALQAKSITLRAQGAALNVVARGALELRSAGDIALEAGSTQGALVSVVSAKNAFIVAGGRLGLKGGSGNGAYALLDPTDTGSDMTVNVASVNLQGGAGAGAYAALVSAGGPLNLSASSVNLAAGTGVDADAVILAPNARALLASYGGIGLSSTNPLGNGLTDVGYFALNSAGSAQTVAADFLTQQNSNFLSTFLTLWKREKRQSQPDVTFGSAQCGSGG